MADDQEAPPRSPDGVGTTPGKPGYYKIPGAPVVPAGGGLKEAVSAPPGGVSGRVVTPGDAPNPASREGVVAFWTGKGVPEHVAQGIADSVHRESGFKPWAWAPDDMGSPSGGFYQHHAERLAGLQGYALVKGKPWQDPQIQHEYSFLEVMGKDPIAAKHWQEIVAAPDRATAHALWDKYFERGAGMGGGGVGGGGDRRMVGRFGGMGPHVPKVGGAGEEDDLTDESDRRERDRLRAQLARFAAQNVTPAQTELEVAAPAAAAAPEAAKPAAPPEPSRFREPRISSPETLQMPAIPPPPDLGKGYSSVLASIMAPTDNPLARILPALRQPVRDTPPRG